VRPSGTYRILRGVSLTGLTIFAVFPMYTMIMASLTPAIEIQLGFEWFPEGLTLEPYVAMWQTIDLLHFLFNSTLVSTITTLLSVILGLFVGYAITRHQFVGKGTILHTVMITQTFPGILFLLPLFILYVSLDRAIGLQLVGSYAGLVITYLSFSLPFTIWLMVGYLASVSVETEEAAMTDGCGRLEAFLRITLRMALPGILAVAVFTFISAWSEVLFASVLSNEETRTLPIGFQLFKSGRGTVQWNQLMAASLTISVPVVIVFLWLQRYFVRGLSAGSDR